VDTMLLANNTARRKAERAHDFRYAETTANLIVTSTGTSLTSATDPAGTSITIAGTLSPNVTGAFAIAGTRNSLPMYTRNVAGTIYFLSYTGTAWQITAGGFLTTAGSWTWTTTDTNPAGTGNSYTPATYTGTATATGSTSSISIKRITTVSLAISGGITPIEFLTDEEYNERIRRMTGRIDATTFGASTAAALGVSLPSPLAYQRGQTLYLAPSTLTFPATTTLDVVRWMPDYTTGTDHDFILDHGGDYIVWQSVLEVNKYWKALSPKQEGNIEEPAVEKLAAEALAELIRWDVEIARATSTPPEE